MYLGFECIKRIVNRLVLNQLLKTKTTQVVRSHILSEATVAKILVQLLHRAEGTVGYGPCKSEFW